MRRFLLAGASLAALLVAMPAAAEERIRVAPLTVQYHSRVSVEGTGWDSALAVCGGETIEIFLIQADRRRLAIVPSWFVSGAPVGGFLVRTAGLSSAVDPELGRAWIEARQRHRVFSGGRCAPAPDLTARVRIRVAIEDDIPELTYREATLWVLPGDSGRLPPRLAPLGNATLPPPPTPCLDPGGCDEPAPDPAAGVPRATIGERVRVVGTHWDLPDGCDEKMRLTLTDSTGTRFALGTTRTRPDGTLDVFFVVPGRGISTGLGVVQAATVVRSTRCRKEQPRPIYIVPPVVTLSAPSVLPVGGFVEIAGRGWRTDRCDGLVQLFVETPAARTLVASVDPRAKGAFRVRVRVPATLAANARVRFSGRQRSSLEVTGADGRSRCYAARTEVTESKSTAWKPVSAPAPSPPPPPPSPPPPPAPPPTTPPPQPPPPPPPPEEKPECNNGKDDDGDGNVDFPNDKDCKDASDDDESK